MKREELLRSHEYWLTKVQNELFNIMAQYKKDKSLNKTQLAAELGIKKEFISQILNGDFDCKISELVDLSLALNRVPIILYVGTD